MQWSEPTTWKRIKENARELARVYRWRRMCVVSGALALAGCLAVRFLLPYSADVLTVHRIMLVVCVIAFCPLILFLGTLQTGSVVFQKKGLSVSDSFSLVRCYIPYEQIVSLGFERLGDKTYFYVRGVPLRAEDEVEVHVALTAKYTQSGIEAYIVQRGLGRLLAVTRELEAPPVWKAKMRSPESEKVAVLVLGPLALLLVDGFVIMVLSGRAMTYWLPLAFIVDLIVYVQLFHSGAMIKDTSKQNKRMRLSVRQAKRLSVAEVLLLNLLLPPLVFAVLWRIGLSPAIVWTSFAVWQLVWMALVYGIGRMFRVEKRNDE